MIFALIECEGSAEAVKGRSLFTTLSRQQERSVSSLGKRMIAFSIKKLSLKRTCNLQCYKASKKQNQYLNPNLLSSEISMEKERRKERNRGRKEGRERFLWPT